MKRSDLTDKSLTVMAVAPFFSDVAANGRTIKGLRDQPGHKAAKYDADTGAAGQVVDMCLRNNLRVVNGALENLYISRLKLALAALDGGEPILAVSFRNGSPNKVALAFATKLAQELGLTVTRIEYKSEKAQKEIKDTATKIFNTPDYSGKIEPGRTYILVDDYVVSGTTMAQQSSYIQQQGGKVAPFACTLATEDGYDVELAPKQADVEKLMHGFCSRVNSWVQHKIGTANGLTLPEIKALSSPDGSRSLLAAALT